MKNNSELSISELKIKEKTLKNITIIYAVILAMLVCLSVLITIQQGFSVFTVFPIVISGAFAPMIVNLRNVRREIAGRTV